MCCSFSSCIVRGAEYQGLRSSSQDFLDSLLPCLDSPFTFVISLLLTFGVHLESSLLYICYGCFFLTGSYLFLWAGLGGCLVAGWGLALLFMHLHLTASPKSIFIFHVSQIIVISWCLLREKKLHFYLSVKGPGYCETSHSSHCLL